MFLKYFKILKYIYHYAWLKDSIAYIHISEMPEDVEKTHDAIEKIFNYFNCFVIKYSKSNVRKL